MRLGVHEDYKWSKASIFCISQTELTRTHLAVFVNDYQALEIMIQQV